jgi:acyl-CoA synthetase (AMP-forming)/AMP-acid ligase II
MSFSLHPSFCLFENARWITASEIIHLSVEYKNSEPLILYKDSKVSGLLKALCHLEKYRHDLYLCRDLSHDPGPAFETKTQESHKVWIQSSGTTATPKWVPHDMASLVSRIKIGHSPSRWGLTYHPFSFAGLQVILTAALGGHALIVPPIGASVADMASLSLTTQPTHLSGTPSFWRSFLIAIGDHPLELKGITLGGEASDQAILNALKQRWPLAQLRHIYATTETGVVFSVTDGMAGFPDAWLTPNLYLSPNDTLIVNGFDTKDVVEQAEGRVHFKGRLDSMVNIGGTKVFPEAVEAFILTCPVVADCVISTRPNPITGYVLMANIGLKPNLNTINPEAVVKAHIQTLPRSQRPVSVKFVETIAINQTGKKQRLTHE